MPDKEQRTKKIFDFHRNEVPAIFGFHPKFVRARSSGKFRQSSVFFYDKKYIYNTINKLIMNSDITEVSHSEVGHDYRLKKFTDIQMNLEEERIRRRRLSENYYRIVTWVNNSDAVLIAVSMGLGIAGVGLLSTIVAAPVVVRLRDIVDMYRSSEHHWKIRE